MLHLSDLGKKMGGDGFVSYDGLCLGGWDGFEGQADTRSPSLQRGCGAQAINSWVDLGEGVAKGGDTGVAVHEGAEEERDDADVVVEGEQQGVVVWIGREGDGGEGGEWRCEEQGPSEEEWGGFSGVREGGTGPKEAFHGIEQ